jgi:phosphocarrier protein
MVKTASMFDARVEVIRLPREGEASTDAIRTAGATSILSLLMLAGDIGSEIELHGEGAQAQEALAAIIALVARKFDEEE